MFARMHVHIYAKVAPQQSKGGNALKAAPCPKCGGDGEKVAVVVNSGKLYQPSICIACNRKRALLSQMFGTWPIPVFSELTPGQQTLFWEKASNEKSKQGLEQLLVCEISNVRLKVETERVGGRYLPLDVYKVQGYDIHSIAKNCKCVYDEALQTDTYLLDVKEVHFDSIKKSTATMIANLRHSSLRSKLSHYCSPSAKPERSNKKRKGKSSYSSSGSKSSSSDDKPPSKQELVAKAKADNAAKKEAAANQKAESKAAAAAEKVVKMEQAKQSAQIALAERTVKKQAWAPACMKHALRSSHQCPL